MNRIFFDSIEMVMVDYFGAEHNYRVTKLLIFCVIFTIKRLSITIFFSFINFYKLKCRIIHNI